MESRGRTIPEACGSPQSLRNTKTAGEIYLKITPLLIKLGNCISLAQLNVKGHLVLCGSKENSKMWQSRQRTEGQLAVHGDHHTASWVSSMLGAQFLPRAFPQARALTWQDWAGGGGARRYRDADSNRASPPGTPAHSEDDASTGLASSHSHGSPAHTSAAPASPSPPAGPDFRVTFA